MKTPKKYSMIDADYLWFNISTSEWQRRRGSSRGLWTEYLPCIIQVMKIGTLEPGDQRMCLYRWTPGTVVMQIQGMESNSKLCWVSLFYLSETPGFRRVLTAAALWEDWALRNQFVRVRSCKVATKMLSFWWNLRFGRCIHSRVCAVRMESHLQSRKETFLLFDQDVHFD